MPARRSFSLTALVLQGTLGGARAGMTRAEILATLGAPDDWSADATGPERARILRYGNFEVHLDEHDRCWMLFNDYVRAGLDAGDGRTLERWLDDDTADVDTVVAHLRAASAEVVIEVRDGWRYVQVVGGARLSFDEDGCWAVVDVSTT